MNKRTANKCDEILKKASLRRTKPRKQVLSVLLKSKKPLTQEQIADKLKKRADKVTIYRTLETFMEAGIIHKAYLRERTWHFELADRCSEKQCHPHFTCTNCGEMRCMPEIVMPMAKSPDKNYRITHQQVRLEGLCPKCLSKQILFTRRDLING